ncbi:enoyl-CoA hydratase/isomerase family protein [Actinospica durhamensis]|uniref:Enoyl-CoA hydratase/isomerase family protein n=1 Tax=Actinospica durhamensis TaxID=1508375 RepID=A0A941EV68_9ACTN|nr:enoyl-CoA hydratase/isomerase family protein [Actinospica durhamensis]
MRYDRDDDGVVTLTLDLPGSANVMNSTYRTAMAGAVGRLEAERATIAGVVITSAKKSFFAGADLNELIRATPELLDEFTSMLTDVKGQMRRLERLGVPVAAAVTGSALGGGLELALACHHRVCWDDASVRIGLPETTLGLLPGGGGVTRSVRMMGVQAALGLITEGRQLRPAAALAAGWVDELVPSRADVVERARAWVLANPSATQPWDRPGHRVPDLRPLDPSTYGLLSAAPAVSYQRTHGCYPAVDAAIACAVEGALLDFDTALEIEGRYLTELVLGQVSKNMISAFWFQLNEINAGGSRPQGLPRTPVRRVGVLGAGMMGVGIAHVSAQAGIEVVLKDVDTTAAERGKAAIAERIERDVVKGRLDAQARDALLARITPADAYDALAGCDLIIEAVFEDRDVKNAVLAEAAAAAPDAVVASNTSTLPITGLAKAVATPERFVGLHFFSPVHRMRLVEIIRGEHTSDETLARAFDFVLQIKKTPIVVNDSRGFYTSRVFGTYVTEGIAMLAEGLPAALVENVARRSGMALGPLEVCDEVTLTLPLKVREQALKDGQEELAHPAYGVIEAMVALGRTGKAAGSGFYDYAAGGGKRLWDGLAQRWGRSDRQQGERAPRAGSVRGAEAGVGIPEQDVRDRLLYIQALETVRVLDEGVLRAVADANLGSIFGIGFAPWTGGTLQFVNSVGAETFVARADFLADAYGERFRPPASLRELAATGGRY